MVVSNGAVQTINDTFVANVISKAVFSAKIVIIFVNLIFLTPYLPIMVTWR